jgi:hypothetical protein
VNPAGPVKGEFQVIYEGTAAERKLKQLGLDVPLIHEVLLYANAEAATYTTFDPPGAGEYARWSREVRRMTELLVLDDWIRINPDNQPTIVHPSKKWCLVVTSGSSGVGVRYATPTTKNPKGRSIRDAVMENAELALLGPQDVNPALAGLRETWTLLTYVNINDEIQAEISLPKEMPGDQITAWEHRILIPTIDPSSGPEVQGGEEEPPSYDFDVVRK